MTPEAVGIVEDKLWELIAVQQNTGWIPLDALPVLVGAGFNLTTAVANLHAEELASMWTSLINWGLAESADKSAYVPGLEKAFGSLPSCISWYKHARTAGLGPEDSELKPIYGSSISARALPSPLTWSLEQEGIVKVREREAVAPSGADLSVLAASEDWPAEDDPQWTDILGGIYKKYRMPKSREDVRAWVERNKGSTWSIYHVFRQEEGINESLEELRTIGAEYFAGLETSAGTSGLTPGMGSAADPSNTV